MPPILPMAPWMPDQPDLADATSIAINVVPVTTESYGPLPATAPYSTNAMDGQCLGAVCVEGNDQEVGLFAGTADKLYNLTGTAPAWVDVSGAAYSTAPGDSWRFALFNDSVISTNFGDTPQSFALGSSAAFGPLMTAPAWAPSTAYSVVGSYVLAGGNRYVLTASGTSAATGVGPTGTGVGIVDGVSASAWEPSTAYAVGTTALAGSNVYIVTTGGMSAATGTGPTGTGTGIVDGLTATAWAPLTAYSTLNMRVSANGNVYQLVVAGTSAASGTGPSGTGSLIVDGYTASPWTAATVYPTLGVTVSANGNVYTLAQVGTSASTGTGPSGTGGGITDGSAIAAWVANTVYSVLGTLVSNGGNVYELAQAGTSAASGGPTGTTWGIADNTCVWDFIAAPWAASTAYSTAGTRVVASSNVYLLIQTGTSASSGAGPSGVSSDIADGTCQWSYQVGQACRWNFTYHGAAGWEYVAGTAVVWNYQSAAGAQWNYQSGAPPNARHICTPKNFLMLGNTYDPVGGLGPKRVWWPASNDATSWPAPGTNEAIESMSDYNDFEGNFGEITGLVDSLANADVAIFFRHAVWRGLFVGPPDVFDFFPTENVRGCPAPNSIISIGSLVYYLGEDGFYVFDGANSTPLGANKFDKWFWATVNQQFLWNVVGAAFVANKAAVWIFPSIASSSGECDTMLIYRWDIQRAAYATFPTATLEWILRSLTFGVTLDGMYALGFTDIDTLPASLDSAIWIGGVLQLSAINSAHELTYFTGPNMAAQVATKTIQLTEGKRTFVQSCRPLVDINTGTPSVAMAARVQLYDPEVFGPSVTPNVAGECPQRSDGRYHNAEVSIPAGAAWTHIVGVDVTAIPGGTR